MRKNSNLSRVVAVAFAALSLLVTAQGSCADAYGSGWYASLATGLSNEDNVSRTYSTLDREVDNNASISVGGGYSTIVGSKSQLNLFGGVSYQHASEFDDLSSATVTLSAEYVWQPRVGYAHPWYTLKTRAQALDYKNSKIRQGSLADIELIRAQRLANELVVRAGLRWHKRLSREQAFDLSRRGAWLGFDYEVWQGAFVFTEFGYAKGTFAASVSRALGPAKNLVYEAKSSDPVFPVNCGAPACELHRYAYRLQAEMTDLTVGISFKLGRTRVDLSALRFDAESDGHDYDNQVVALDFGWTL